VSPRPSPQGGATRFERAMYFGRAMSKDHQPSLYAGAPALGREALLRPRM